MRTSNLLSCTNCRQRKIKCDKKDLCTPCEKAGLRCVFPERQPRASAKRKRESVPDSIEPAFAASDPGSAPSHEEQTRNVFYDATSLSNTSPMLGEKDRQTHTAAAVRNADTLCTEKENLETRYATFVERQDRTRYLNTAFWNQLDGSTITTNHTLLDDCPRGAATTTAHTSCLADPIEPDISSLFVFGGGQGLHQEAQTSDLSEEQRSALFHVYFAHVHPVCRILHQPTALTFLSRVQELTDPRTRRLKFSSLEAISCAICFAAVISLTAADCNTRLGVDKASLAAHLRRRTELALAASDLPNTREIVTLQAFTLYIISIHSEESTQSSWALLGLAVRISQGLGLHRDGDGASWDPFHGEMRRRLWWHIVELDVLMAHDRASEPLISEGSFTTEMPLNVDDIDFDQDSIQLIHDRNQMTDMTLPLTFINGLDILRKINQKHTTIQAKADLASSFTDKLESVYLGIGNGSRAYDMSDGRTWLVYMSGQLLSLMMWLAMQYPLHSHARDPDDLSKSHALRTAVALLALSDRIEREPIASRFSWWFRMFVPWHALAVALSMLCAERHGEPAKQAWPIVHKMYHKCASRMANIRQSDVWKPIQMLMAKACPADATIEQSPLGTAEHVSNIINADHPKDPFSGAPFEAASQIHLAFNNSGMYAWDLDIPTGNTWDDNVSWENWNEFVDDLASCTQNHGLAMTDAWSM